MVDKEDIVSRFYSALEKKGYKGKVVSAKHLPELRNDIKKHRDVNSIYPELYEEYKSYFEFEPDVPFSEVNSLFIMASPVPQYEAIFQWKGEKVSLMIPPTYLYGVKLIEQLTELVSEILKPDGYHATYAQIPQKTLAVRSGLAEYGRNNITYVPGMGSFYRLTTLYSDFPTEEDNWQELRFMNSCEKCQACTNACPTGAIPTDRFLLRVERCITFHNEHPINRPFPEWMDPSWHNCVVGCLHCQKACPVNKKVINWTEPGPTFTEEETTMILSGVDLEDLPQATKETIEKFDLVNYYDILPRNLGIFLK
jgi:epoxyqueuosine reductase